MQASISDWQVDIGATLSLQKPHADVVKWANIAALAQGFILKTWPMYFIQSVFQQGGPSVATS